MISFSVEVDDAFFAESFPSLKGLDGDLNELFKKEIEQSQAAILNRLRTTFLAEQDPYGNPWLQSRAAKARRKRGGTGTMFDSGKLFRSIQLSAAPKPHERAIVSDVPYGLKHQFGTDGMVKREFMTITPEHEQLARSIFEHKVRELYNV